MQPRFSAPDWCFYNAGMSPEEYYTTLRSVGVNAVEMADRDRWPVIRASGLDILNIPGPGMQEGLNRRENHAKLIPEIRAMVDLAGTEGIPHIIVFSGNRGGQSDEDGIAQCTDALAELAPYAQAAGVTLLLEMLNTFDHDDYQASHGSYGFRVARNVNSPAVRVLYDVYHMFRMGDDVLSDMLANLDLITHIHIADSPARTKPAADGVIDYRTIVSAISRHGYSGHFGLEFVPGEDAFRDIRDSLDLLR